MIDKLHVWAGRSKEAKFLTTFLAGAATGLLLLAIFGGALNYLEWLLAWTIGCILGRGLIWLLSQWIEFED